MKNAWITVLAIPARVMTLTGVMLAWLTGQNGIPFPARWRAGAMSCYYTQRGWVVRICGRSRPPSRPSLRLYWPLVPSPGLDRAAPRPLGLEGPDLLRRTDVLLRPIGRLPPAVPELPPPTGAAGMAARPIFGRLLHLAVLARLSAGRITGIFARGILTHALGLLPLLLGLQVVPPLSGYPPRGSLTLLLVIFELVLMRFPLSCLRRWVPLNLLPPVRGLLTLVLAMVGQLPAPLLPPQLLDLVVLLPLWLDALHRSLPAPLRVPHVTSV